MFVETQVRYIALFTYLFGWHAGAVSLPLSDIILAQLACLLSGVMFCLHSKITILSLYKQCSTVHILRPWRKLHCNWLECFMIEQFAQNKSSLLLKNRDGRGHKHAHYRSRELSYRILEVQNWYRELMYQNATVFSGRGEKFREYWVDTIQYKLPMVPFQDILKLYHYMFQFSICTWFCAQNVVQTTDCKKGTPTLNTIGLFATLHERHLA